MYTIINNQPVRLRLIEGQILLLVPQEGSRKVNSAPQLLSGDKGAAQADPQCQRGRLSKKDPQQMAELLHYEEQRMDCRWRWEGTQLSLDKNLLI